MNHDKKISKKVISAHSRLLLLLMPVLSTPFGAAGGVGVPVEAGGTGVVVGLSRGRSPWNHLPVLARISCLRWHSEHVSTCWNKKNR